MTDQRRTIASVALVVVAALLLVFGLLTLYARQEVLAEEAFADRAAEALEDDEVRRVVGREIVVNLIDRGSTDLVAARPLLESVVDAALDTGAFRRLFRSAAIQANRILFVRDRDDVALDLSAAAELVTFGLRSVSPKLAREVPEDFDPELLRIRHGTFTTQTLQVADGVRVLGILLPLLAVALLVAAIVVCPDRRAGVLRAGVGVGAAASLVAIALLILRERIVAGVVGSDEVTDDEMQEAIGGALDAFFGDLFAWSLLLALGGLVVAGAAAALDPSDVEDPVTRLRHRLTARPRTTWARAVRGAVALLLGVFVALNPTLALQVAAVVFGAYLCFFGASELLVLLQPARRAVPERVRRRSLATALGAGAGAVAAAVVLIVVITSGGGEEEGPGSRVACNGSRDLCGLRLNEVVFAGTHNSFSAADSRGWFIANQRRTISRQLADGIRLFLIDPHWGVQDRRSGRVRTDFDSERRDRNKVAKALPPDTLRAAQQVAGDVGLGELEGGKRGVWLCHTVCELGATRMQDSLEDIRRFLERNRREVVVLFIEPYVSPREIEKEFQRAGLERHVAELNRDEPLPTLGELVRDDKRVVVLTEKDADGTVPWYLDGFSFVQDTPLGAERRDQLSCRLERGTTDSPLLMLNHWADLFPPRLQANRPFQRGDFILERARRCSLQRGLPVNLIAVDFYDQGDLIETVADLNRQQVRNIRRERRLAAGSG